MIKDIVARGFGTFSSVGFVPARGYSIETVSAAASVIPFDIGFHRVQDATIKFAKIQVTAPQFHRVQDAAARLAKTHDTAPRFQRVRSQIDKFSQR